MAQSKNFLATTVDEEKTFIKAYKWRTDRPTYDASWIAEMAAREAGFVVHEDFMVAPVVVLGQDPSVPPVVMSTTITFGAGGRGEVCARREERLQMLMALQSVTSAMDLSFDDGTDAAFVAFRDIECLVAISTARPDIYPILHGLKPHIQSFGDSKVWAFVAKVSGVVTVTRLLFEGLFRSHASVNSPTLYKTLFPCVC